MSLKPVRKRIGYGTNVEAVIGEHGEEMQDRWTTLNVADGTDPIGRTWRKSTPRNKSRPKELRC